jgi:hypothetical protein
MICLLAFKSKTKGNLYLNYAINLINKIQQESNIPITLMTDDKSFFNGKLVHIIEKENISYTDKIKVCEVALKYGYTAVYIDVDTTLDFKLLEQTNFSSGFHFWWWWKLEWRIYEHISNNKYFKKLEDYCITHSLSINDAPLIHEGFFVIKTGNNIEKFLTIYNELSPVAIENDIEHNNYPTGRAEGLLMGISLINSGFMNNGCGNQMMLLGHNLQQDKSPEMKHLRHNIENVMLLNNKKII